MIPVNELMRGNYVNKPNYHYKTQIICAVKWIKDNVIYFDDAEDTEEKYRDKFSFEEVSPILLTPEILLKCGFSERALAFTGNLGFTITDENYYIGLLSDQKGGWKFHNPHFNLSVQYLHQLQNLYFALTGIELPITL